MIDIQRHIRNQGDINLFDAVAPVDLDVTIAPGLCEEYHLFLASGVFVKRIDCSWTYLETE